MLSSQIEQFQQNPRVNGRTMASSSLAVMHLKTFQMQSDDPNNGILRIKSTYLFLCLGE